MLGVGENKAEWGGSSRATMRLGYIDASVIEQSLWQDNNS